MADGRGRYELKIEKYKKMEPHGFGEAVRFAVIMEVFSSAKGWGTLPHERKRISFLYGYYKRRLR